MARKKKETLAAGFTAEELALLKKYPDRPIKACSLLGPGARPEFGPKKRTLILVCPCGNERIVATSDLFQVKLCKECTDRERKERIKDRKGGEEKPRANGRKSE